jgi:hypothetical protein
VALLALGELGRDEVRRRALDDVLVEARNQVVIELAVTEQIPRLEHRGAHRHVGFGLADAFGDGARRMADLEPHVPETIKDRLGDRFAPGRLFVWKQEQEIDVRARRQHAATVTAGADDRHALGFRRVLRAIEMLGYELVEHAQDLILHPAQPLGTTAARAFLDQQPLGCGATLQEGGLEPARYRQSELALVAGVIRNEAFELAGNSGGVEHFDSEWRLFVRGQHGAAIVAPARSGALGFGVESSEKSRLGRVPYGQHFTSLH